MLNLLKDLGIPDVIVGVVAGSIIGASPMLYFMQREASAHLAETGALTTQLTQLQSQNKELREALDIQKTQTQAAQATGCLQWQIELQKLAQWNKECRDTSAEISRHNVLWQQRDVLWQQRDVLARELEKLRSSWTDAARGVTRFTGGQCADNNNPCDLNPLAQRKLRALEAERDQLHAQLLEMQARIISIK